MHNRNGIAKLDNGAQLSGMAIVPDWSPLPKSALIDRIAPTSTSGCISELSSDSIHAVERGYASAMKNYAVLYEQFQSYLMPRNALLPHDYELSVKLAALANPLGCLNEELVASTLHEDDISDDDIEGCGYMGWLHH